MFRLLSFCYLLVGLTTVSLAQRQPKATPSAKSAKPRSATATVSDSLPRARVGALARSYGDSVVVRWAPDNALLFKAATRGGGYRVMRMSQAPGQGLQLDYTRTVAPWSVDEWKQRFSPRDSLAGACLQVLWGKNEVVRGEATFDQILRQKQQADLRLMMGLTLADVNPRYARAMGLGMTDTDVKRGVTYIYSIAPLVNQQQNPADSALVSVTNTGPLPRLQMLPVVGQSGDRVIKLLWNRDLADREFTAYYIERSDNNGQTFRRITRRPWIQPIDGPNKQDITFQDSLAQNYRSYQYRVIGLNPFGEQSLPTVVTVRGVDRTPPGAVSQLKAEHLGGSRVRLTWQHTKAPADLSGYLIGKATAIDGQYTPLITTTLPASQRTFTDTTAIPSLQAYYVVVALDTAKNASPSSPAYCMFTDKSGPTQPKGLKGYIDSTGFVRIVWERSKEPDLMGYKVLMANDPTHLFIPVTKTYQSVAFFDNTTSLNTLTKRLYYRVVAYDRSYNPSPASAILTLTRPDKVRPSAPAIKSYVASDTTVQLTWVNSASDDVFQQRLLRRGASTERWHELARLPRRQTSYVDASIKANESYQYTLIAVDSAGLQSPESYPLTVRTLQTRTQPAQQLRASLTTDQKAVVLNWKLPNDLARYVIYRGDNGQPLRSYDAVNREHTFTDKAIPKGRYEYAVKVIYQDGRESGLSNRVKIDIN
ncbi:hypothetical protein GCM10028819_30380 [Spirosoma humi]